MLNYYYTVKQAGTHEIIIQKSRFIGYVERVKSAEEAQQFVQKIKKKHHDATHNCSAYLIGDHDEIQKANDDGEPSGTAGIPMLDVLKKLQLKNTAVVVTRYFGGIKLGAGGLIRAYSSTTSETIKTIGIVKGELMQGISLSIEYPLLGKVENALRMSSHVIDHINYLEKVELIVYVHIGVADSFQAEMIDLTNNQIILNEIDKKYIETIVS
ncbi:YigZ family protein [Pseudogracilibacillus auburnensis]|uniref:Putative YigZ family protein n=1 Tax=Pseudogracilibacillus auburnensis TaxID=1494959 RepID=A0A2V3W5Z6_9BACI|nr:YigZ family protein [Pseudogracilibacillus auburnensis]MBO1001529.1 YigZ family protein [Pseudogracilibacillus auburnensis]PXW89552.1 putative YigZ family protein [Pseudogracilibacillus auburnensis]